MRYAHPWPVATLLEVRTAFSFQLMGVAWALAKGFFPDFQFDKISPEFDVTLEALIYRSCSKPVSPIVASRVPEA
ncbi:MULTISPECIES: hypothetical protein [Moorena]|uniref:Uncharacterized protein n=1 Tax=Moorena producens 3L TaxID=489825 RepID=F4XNQ6_9CYAN|nr:MULTISPECIES: hypothetical protein [Moorena]NEQ13153.1 hypothetical protein [Moorena sp. SIO3E2]EGJ33677.1 hypothetical protein LYNGBM3L_25510 [Moorena producens 3L]NEP35716.1 hypothetical protein [Moorena sp. SIO3B2]NEP67995.1 hypothetical protein [Moorena sp. SIO3A5]NEQ09959.1 hypothetical protein [Moorena sp. SIO4E2]